MYKKYLNVGFLLLLMISALNGCKKETKEQYPVVIIDKPLKQDVKIYGEYVGQIEPVAYVELQARVEVYLE